MRLTLWIFIGLVLLTNSISVLAQTGIRRDNLTDTSRLTDTSHKPVVRAADTTLLEKVVVNGVRTISGMGRLDETHYGVVYSGKKTEVLILDSLDANTAQNNPRQVLGRIPGANYSETQGSGFPSNGISFRGLNPSQSIETNTRQNGYNITADIYGYSESYYLPPLEAVERIEVTRGESSLQFGPQFGGVVNYIVKEGNRNRPFEYNTEQTGGSYGFVNSYHAVGGQAGKLNYFGFGQYQAAQGQRPNSDYRQVSAFGKLSYQANKRLKLGVEYTLFRNRIHMPGGFDDAQFNHNPDTSYRARNWLTSPWNIVAARAEYALSPNTTIYLTSSYLFSSRSLVWKNEDGGPGTPDSISTVTLQYVNREVQKEKMDPQYGYDLNYRTTNIAPFAENIFRVTNRLSITPGIRYEYIRSTVKGYITDGSEVNSDLAKNRSIGLFGIGAQYKTSGTTNIYGNISQAYSPVTYDQLTKFGSTARVDPNLKDAKGYNADLGWRGTVGNYFNFDVDGFWLAYNNRFGSVELTDASGNPYIFQTNIAKSVSKGIEAYIEFRPTRLLKNNRAGNFSFFNSFAYIDAKYTSGPYKGNTVEYAPKIINRLGLTYSKNIISTTFLLSMTTKSYGDASNVVSSTDPAAGIIPSYTVMDWSATVKLTDSYHIKGGVNNLADQKYFTKRTTEYPGPGIIPAMRRSFYLSFGASF